MCELHWVKSFAAFPVKLNPQAWKLHVKSLHCRSPKNRSQVLGKELASRQDLRGLTVEKCFTFRSRKPTSQQLCPSGGAWMPSRAPLGLPGYAEHLLFQAAEKLAQRDLTTKLAHQREGVLWCPFEVQSPRIRASFLASNLRICTNPCVNDGSCTWFKLCYCYIEDLVHVYVFLCFFVFLSVSS